MSNLILMNPLKALKTEIYKIIRHIRCIQIHKHIKCILFICFHYIKGGKFSMMIGIFSYLADITTDKERTYRIGLISIVYTVSVPFGMAFSGILLR